MALNLLFYGGLIFSFSFPLSLSHIWLSFLTLSPEFLALLLHLVDIMITFALSTFSFFTHPWKWAWLMVSLHRVLILLSEDLITRPLYNLACFHGHGGNNQDPMIGWEWKKGTEEETGRLGLNLSHAGIVTILLCSLCSFSPCLFVSFSSCLCLSHTFL